MLNWLRKLRVKKTTRIDRDPVVPQRNRIQRSLIHKTPAVSEEDGSQWCLIGNIVESHPFGPGGAETKKGTKHFSPGTKVYCFPAQWGDGYEKIVVIGRHRGSKQFSTMVIRSEWVTNWRMKVVYHPEVLKKLQAGKEHGGRNWRSKEEVEYHLRAVLDREGTG